MAAGIALLLAGALAGASLDSHETQISAQRDRIHALQHSLTAAQSQAANAKTRMDAAQAQARTASATATAKAAAAYASREEAVHKLLAKLTREQGIVQASKISEDGVYVVGKDIPSGVYHTSGAPGGGQPGGQCYFATLSSTNTGDILDNNNFNGPETVSVSGAYALQISGGCAWIKEN